MSRAFVCLVAVLALTWMRPVLGASPDDGGAIRGRVVDAASDRPLRNGRVHVESVAMRDGITVQSGANGEFEFTALAAGTYTVTASKASYISGAYGQPRPLGPSAPVTVAANLTIEHIDVRLVKGGGLGGTITNEYGKPLAHLEVSAMRYQFVQGIRRLVSAGSRSTDDNGAFSVFGLPPGRYYLAATPVDWSEPDVVTPRTYAPTYYPGTTSLAVARMFTLPASKTIRHLHMKLVTQRAARVSGIVTGPVGLPLRGGLVTASIRPGSGPEYSRDGRVNADGTFSIEGLAAGDYLIRAESFDPVESATVRLAIGTADISGLRLTVSKPSIVNGRIVIDPTERGALTGSAFRLAVPAARPEEAGLAGGAGSAAKDDFTFGVEAQPGRVLIRYTGTDWLLRAVRLNGMDVTDGGIEIRPGQSVDGVEAELTRQPDISGTVLTESGTVTRDAFVVMFSTDPGRWGYQSRYVRMSRPNAESRFRIVVPPGDFLAVAVSDLEDGEWSDPAFLERVRGRALAVTVGDRDKRTLDLTLTRVPRR